jgi:CubicO group peptidase (beta-lactamase class C family)
MPLATTIDAGERLLHRFTEGFNANELSAIDTLVANFMGRYGVPGMSIAMTREGRLVYAKGFGIIRRLSSWERFGSVLPVPEIGIDGGIRFHFPRRPNPRVNPWHLFRIASVTKPITSVAIMRLIEQRRVNLTDRVFGAGGLLGNSFGFGTLDSFVPIPGSALETNIKWLKQITVQHLLEHTCGGWNNNFAQDPMFLIPTMNHADLITWVLWNRPLTNQPGTTYEYSNFGYCLLGRIIEQVTGKTYAEHVKTDVLSRCGIQNMHIAGNTRSERRDDEVEYFGQYFQPPNQSIFQAPLFDDPYDIPVARMDSHGGWLASPVDLVRFAVHVDGFSHPPAPFILTDDIINANTVNVMTTVSPQSMAATPPTNYARGWAIGPTFWTHMGALPGSQATLIRTNNDICLAAATNTWRRAWPTPPIDADFQNAMLNVINTVTQWPGHNLFPLFDNPWGALPSVHLKPVPFGTSP